MVAEDALVSGDNMMSARGTGTIRAGVVTVSIGTFGMICAFRINQWST
jgi:sugar (pentulose or hexulose) kinase